MSLDRNSGIEHATVARNLGSKSYSELALEKADQLEKNGEKARAAQMRQAAFDLSANGD